MKKASRIVKGGQVDMRNIRALLVVSILIFTLTACVGDVVEPAATQPASESGDGSGSTAGTEQTPEATARPISVEYDGDDLDSSASSADMRAIALEGNSITFDGGGATVDGATITVTSAGVYSIRGTLDDGQVIVDTEDEETVVLVLNGVDIACSTSAPIYILNAEKTVITLADGTENRVTDGDVYVFENAESDEPNAAIFSKDDLTINGNGSLMVHANCSNGIVSKDDLKITGGSITVNAVNDGIKGKDSIAVRDGVITIDAGGDGMQSYNDADVEKGYISLEGGTFAITAGLDGIQAETRLLVSGGSITIFSGGGSVNSSSGDGWGKWGAEGNPDDDGSGDSAKGLKAGVDVTILGGTFDIDSSDDAIHSNGSLKIGGGDLLLASGDDGIHSDSTLEISGGDLSIIKSYEGIESSTITIDDGTMRIVASDDGINAVGGNDGSAMGGRPGQNPFDFSGDHHLYVNGGYLVIDVTGDGLDINGPIDMTGGVVIVNGPTGNNNGALDYAGAFNITGGFLVAVGSSGMAQAPSASSTQYSVMHTFPLPQAAGAMVHVEAEGGEEILTFVPTKAYQSVVLSSPELENGSTYFVYSGGSSTGTVADGLYSGGTYTPGAQAAEFTISSIVTGAGPGGRGFPGGGGGGPRPPGGGGGRP
jgi:hypothetical protein